MSAYTISTLILNYFTSVYRVIDVILTFLYVGVIILISHLIPPPFPIPHPPSPSPIIPQCPLLLSLRICSSSYKQSLSLTRVFLFKKDLCFIYLYVCVWERVHACRDQKRALDPQELELQVFLWAASPYMKTILDEKKVPWKRKSGLLLISLDNISPESGVWSRQWDLPGLSKATLSPCDPFLV